MTLEELKTGMLKRPKDFMYWGELDLSVWGFAPIGKHRDSDLIDESNFDGVLAELRRVSGKSVQVMHANHWACGWYDYIMVRVTATKTMNRLLELINQLADYPVLDEDDLSRREYECACNAYDAWARYDVSKLVEQEGIKALLNSDGDYDPSEEDEQKVRELVTDAIMDYDSSECIYDSATLIDTLYEAFPEKNETEDDSTLTFDFSEGNPDD
jgi:hypothetical protein